MASVAHERAIADDGAPAAEDGADDPVTSRPSYGV
jgi:hypothetical protein